MRPGGATLGNSTNTEAETPARAAGVRGVLGYWGPPIIVGLLVGLGIVAVVRHGGIGRSEVDEIVEAWDWGADAENEALAERIEALGAKARADLIDAFHDVDDEYMDLKVWTAERMLAEPFFDTRYLTEVARGGHGADRRAAAVALARHLREDAETAVVMPGILDWLGDLGRDDQSAAIRALHGLGPLAPEWRDPARDALLGLAARRPPVSDDPDADFVPEVREEAISLGLGRLLPDAQVEELVHRTIADEDDFAPRIAAVRALSENLVFGSKEAWAAAARSRDEVVRQAVAENLFRVTDPAWSDILQPLHVDAHPYVRTGSVDTQVQRRQPTMLPVMDQLLEDHDVWVRFSAMAACAAFRDEPGGSARNGQLLRILAESDEPSDVEGAVLALHTISKKAFGFREVDLLHYTQEIEETALDAFMKDPEGRADAVRRYREAFGGTAVWTAADRRGTLSKLLQHADPDNRKRAERLLAELAQSD